MSEDCEHNISTYFIKRRRLHECGKSFVLVILFKIARRYLIDFYTDGCKVRIYKENGSGVINE